MTALASIILGAALLVWPAFVNGYPLVFSDTGAFLHQTLGPLMIWDKPWIYGPIMHAAHWRSTLWLPLAAQGLAVSHLVWLVARCCGGTGPGRHLLLCAALALTTAPFSVALLMPDVLAPVVVLALGLLGFAEERLSRGERLWLSLLAMLAIASHLSHLPVAGLLVWLVVLLRRALAPTLRVAVPLLGAVLLLLATNLAGHGRLALSPHGATFLLARLVADGPGARTIAAECPGAGWYLCAWAGRLPAHSDDFLWAPDSPVNRDASGAPRFLGGALLAPEAGTIVWRTLQREPLAVLGQGFANGVRQFVTAGAGDTLGNQHLDVTVARMLALGFGSTEQRRFAASRQARSELAELAVPLAWLHTAGLLVGGVVLLWSLARPGLDPATRGLVLAVLVGVAANALATGALSGVNPRYQARIAWLLPMMALVLALPRPRPLAADPTPRPEVARSAMQPRSADKKPAAG